MPSVVARELDNDPENLNLLAAQFLQYSSAKNAFDEGHSESPAWKKSEMMKQVKRNTFDIMKKRAKK